MTTPKEDAAAVAERGALVAPEVVRGLDGSICNVRLTTIEITHETGRRQTRGHRGTDDDSDDSDDPHTANADANRLKHLVVFGESGNGRVLIAHTTDEPTRPSSGASTSLMPPMNVSRSAVAICSAPSSSSSSSSMEKSRRHQSTYYGQPLQAKHFSRQFLTGGELPRLDRLNHHHLSPSKLIDEFSDFPDLFAVGGIGKVDKSVSNVIEKFDAASWMWLKIAALTIPRRDASTCFIRFCRGCHSTAATSSSSSLSAEASTATVADSAGPSTSTATTTLSSLPYEVLLTVGGFGVPRSGGEVGGAAAPAAKAERSTEMLLLPTATTTKTTATRQTDFAGRQRHTGDNDIDSRENNISVWLDNDSENDYVGQAKENNEHHLDNNGSEFVSSSSSSSLSSGSTAAGRGAARCGLASISTSSSSSSVSNSSSSSSAKPICMKSPSAAPTSPTTLAETVASFSPNVAPLSSSSPSPSSAPLLNGVGEGERRRRRENSVAAAECRVGRTILKSGTARIVCPLLYPRANTALIAARGKVFAAGGTNGTDVLRSVEIYDPTSDRWTEGPKLNVARQGATLFAKRIVLPSATKGDSDEEIENKVSEEDTGRSIKGAHGALPAGRHQAGQPRVPVDALIIAGGTDIQGNLVSEVEILTLPLTTAEKKSRWTTLEGNFSDSLQRLQNRDRQTGHHYPAEEDERQGISFPVTLVDAFWTDQLAHDGGDNHRHDDELGEQVCCFCRKGGVRAAVAAIEASATADDTRRWRRAATATGATTSSTASSVTTLGRLRSATDPTTATSSSHFDEGIGDFRRAGVGHKSIKIAEMRKLNPLPRQHRGSVMTFRKSSTMTTMTSISSIISDMKCQNDDGDCRRRY